jgi:hypothetical protein
MDPDDTVSLFLAPYILIVIKGWGSQGSIYSLLVS